MDPAFFYRLRARGPPRAEEVYQRSFPDNVVFQFTLVFSVGLFFLDPMLLYTEEPAVEYEHKAFEIGKLKKSPDSIYFSPHSITVMWTEPEIFPSLPVLGTQRKAIAS